MMKFVVFSFAVLALAAGCSRPLNLKACANHDGGGCPEGTMCVTGPGWSGCVPVDAESSDTTPAVDAAVPADVAQVPDVSPAPDVAMAPDAALDMTPLVPDAPSDRPAPPVDGACTPSCSGKSCGDTDGCGGHCTVQTCAGGQRCVAGNCQCDSTSCASGCCSGNQCFTGTADQQCGIGGGLCNVCSSSTQTCSSHACIACGAPGQPCCAGNTCQAGLAVCRSGICAASNVWAVGNGPGPGRSAGIARWDGSTWKFDVLAGVKYLQALWGFDASRVLAVGQLSTGSPAVAELTGATWQLIDNQISGNDLFAIWGSDPSNIWAVGGGFGSGYVTLGTGTAWAMSSQLVGAYEFNGVFGVASNDVWAVSTNGIWHYDGHMWSGPTVPSGAGSFGTVWAAASNDVWAGGLDDTLTTGVVSHWNGTTWGKAITIGHDVVKLWGTSGKDIWLVGSNASSVGVVNHYDGSQWSKDMEVSGTNGLTAVWSSSPTDVWVGGDCGGSISSGCAAHGNGSTWEQPIAVGSATSVSGLWGVAR
jgi:hypothetical protein